MTEHLCVRKEKAKRAYFTFSQISLGWLGIFCLFLMLRNSAVATEYITRGLRLCAKTIIPSLFPFMVISELILSSGIGNKILRPFMPVFKPLFRLSEQGCYAVLMGMLCGFPVGARCAMSALKSNGLTREEAERVLLFSTNPSTAFLINAVGTSLFGNRRFGVALCVTVLLSQLIVGLLFTHVSTHEKRRDDYATTVRAARIQSVRISKLFTKAIGSASSGILLICAYVVFFSALSGTVNLVLNHTTLPTVIQTVIACILELSSGVSAAGGLPSQDLAMILCAFASGWTGISVHCQLLSVCDGSDLRFRTYFFAKLLQGALCSALIWAWIRIDPSLLISIGGC